MTKTKKIILISLSIISFCLTVAFTNTEKVSINASASRVTYVCRLSRSEKAAKRWVARHESGGNYRARNGNCYGKYQLSRSYLHGNYSHANQEKIADRYVHHRYGSWKHAKRFWQSHHWY